MNFFWLLHHIKNLNYDMLKKFLSMFASAFFANGFSQTKIPAPPPPVPEVKVEKPVPPEKATMPELNLP